MEGIMSLFKLYFLLQEWPVYIGYLREMYLKLSLARKLKNLVLFVAIFLRHNDKR